MGGTHLWFGLYTHKPKVGLTAVTEAKMPVKKLLWGALHTSKKHKGGAVTPKVEFAPHNQ